jgi:hypothetical protein
MASTSAALIRGWPVDGTQGRDGPTVGLPEVVRISSAGACKPDTAVLCASGPHGAPPSAPSAGDVSGSFATCHLSQAIPSLSRSSFVEYPGSPL